MFESNLKKKYLLLFFVLIFLRVFSDTPYYVRGVSINQDVCLCVCARRFKFRVENYTLKLYYALVASYSYIIGL